MSKEFLKLGNHRKICSVYSAILPPDEIAKINAEVAKQTKLIFELGLGHFAFSRKLPKKHWRQRISRLYYAAYNVSKAVRFDSDGTHTADVKDHQKVGLLPDGFPNRARYENQLQSLREDRNSADYDHLATEDGLLLLPKDYEVLVLDFVRDAHDYMSGRGLVLGEKP